MAQSANKALSSFMKVGGVAGANAKKFTFFGTGDIMKAKEEALA